MISIVLLKIWFSNGALRREFHKILLLWKQSYKY